MVAGVQLVVEQLVGAQLVGQQLKVEVKLVEKQPGEV